MTRFNDALPYASRRPILCAENIVSTSQPLAAQAGLKMLYLGGNAVDAALASAIALTVVEPTGTGVGGDAFAIIWDGQRLHGLNASGYSPAAWRPSVFADTTAIPARGWPSVTVPGAVAAWQQLSERFGVLPFKTLFEPAIQYAQAGFMVSPVTAELWKKIAFKYEAQAGFRQYFMPQGRTPYAGERFRNPDLAKTLSLIAESKGQSFYHGELAAAMIDHSSRHGGLMTKEDLAEYAPVWCDPMSQDIGGAQVHELPPNCQGLATLIALGILNCFDLGALDPDGLDCTHLCIEAMKLAFADSQAYIGDPASMPLDPQGLLSKDYLARRAAEIDMSCAQEYAAGAPLHGGTVYLAAADKNGMMISFIQSNYEGFGSGIVVPGTGISMQNRGMAFNFQAGHPNQVGPRKRPFHTIIPGFATKNGQALMAFGVMGGPMQAQGHLQIVVRTQIFGQNPQAATDAPRWQVKQGKEVMVEKTMPEAVICGLRDRGHIVLEEQGNAAFSFGGAQVIQRVDSGYIAGSDHRKDGHAVGF